MSFVHWQLIKQILNDIAIVIYIITDLLLLFANCYLLLLSTICGPFLQTQILQAVDRAAPEVINLVGE